MIIKRESKNKNHDSKERKMKLAKKLLTVALSALFVLSVTAFAFSFTEKSGIKARAQGLTFDEQTWTSNNGQTISGGNVVTVDKTTDAGDNKLILSTIATYKNFHLQYKFKYVDTAVSEPWWGNSGVLLHSSIDSGKISGYYMGFYNWGNDLWASTGYYVGGAYTMLYGVHSGWVGAGLNENMIDVYVKDSHINVLINGWLFQNAPLPYEKTGAISIYSDGISGTYSDFVVEELPEDYDIASKLVRANWSGSNIAGDMYYWNAAGKNHTFRMQLPENSEGIKGYRLVRRSKVSDGGQSVNVYIDKTATLGLTDTWTGDPIVWGDAANNCSHGNSLFGINSVEIPASAFDGVEGGAKVGFLIKKEIAGWYSAAEYWLLYTDSNGVERVADYMDLAYAFDTTAHDFAFDPTEGGEKGYQFVCQNNGIITSHFKGQEFSMVKMPVMSAKGNKIEYTFASDEGAKTFNVSDYINFNNYHTGYKMLFSVDGGEDKETLTLSPRTKNGTITVKCMPDGSANDYSGSIYFDTITCEIEYSTVCNKQFVKNGDPVLYSVGGGQTVDLSEYVTTDIDGTWSYKIGENTYDGSEYTIPTISAEEDITLILTPLDSEEEIKSVTLHVVTTAYAGYPEKVTLPIDKMPQQSNLLTLYGQLNADNGKYIADANNVWGVMTDLGTDSYAVQAVVNASDMLKDKTKHGILLHASIGTKGYSGTLIGLYYRQDIGALYCSVGYLDNGEYTAVSDYDTYFDYAADYRVKVICSGSFIQLSINGYRVFTTYDKYNAGGKIALLNDGGTTEYYDIKAVNYDGNIQDAVFRSDWSGTDTFSSLAVWDKEFTVKFALPQPQNATNFRLVRRTSLWEGEQAATVKSGDTSYGEWKLPSGLGYYGDSVFNLENFDLQGEYATFSINPQGAFKASYMWLIYSVDGVDYIADSVYVGYAEDLKEHELTLQSKQDGDVKRFVHSANNMMLTFAKGEEVVWARELQLTDKMQAKTYSNSEISSVNLPYRLYLPENYDASRKYKLLVFMHGAGERGNDNSSQIATGGIMGTELMMKRIITSKYADEFIVVAPQCPADMRWVERDWTPGKYDFATTEASVPMQLLQSLLNKEILANYSIDRAHVYGAGLSMGGFGIMDLAAREPGLFAAIVNCSGGADDTNGELFATTAVRAYHSETDTTVNNDTLYNFVQTAKNEGREAEYYEVALIGHFSWQAGFEDADLLTWLLNHEKTWRITVELNGGSLTSEIPSTYNYDAQEVTLPAPTKDGWKFGGWFTDAEYKTAIEKFDGNTASDLKLYALWEKEVSVKVIADGNTIAEFTKKSGETVNLAEYVTQKDGYLMIGWSDGKNTYAPTATVKVEDDMVFTAVYEKIETPDSGSDSSSGSDQTPDSGSVSDTDSGSSSGSEMTTKKGCFGGVDAQTAMSIFVVIGAAFAIRRKRRD